MGLSDFRLRLYSGALGHSDSDQVLKPWFRNFGVCPHCQKKGAPFLLERLNNAGPMISRSDGDSFHLVLGDRPISFPAEKGSGKTSMMTAGFWYVSERRAGSQESEEFAGTKGFTETVVVILRKPPKGGPPLMRHLELLADTLAEKITRQGRLATFYEFDGKQLHRNPYT
jgi:hypothetical protein